MCSSGPGIFQTNFTEIRDIQSTLHVRRQVKERKGPLAAMGGVVGVDTTGVLLMGILPGVAEAYLAQAVSQGGRVMSPHRAASCAQHRWGRKDVLPFAGRDQRRGRT